MSSDSARRPLLACQRTRLYARARSPLRCLNPAGCPASFCCRYWFNVDEVQRARFKSRRGESDHMSGFVHSAPALIVDGPTLRDARTAAASSAVSGPARLREACREEIARLARIVRELSCNALLRGTDGSVIPLITTVEGEISAPISHEPTVSAPIYDYDGSAMASIALFENAGRIAEPIEHILRVLLRSTARAMSERWFRLFHRREWIIAALREDEAHTSIILAADRSRKLLGADHAAREFLKTTGRRFEPGLTVAEFFGCDFTPGRGRRYCDVALHLQSCDASSPWRALITPPDLGAVQGRGHERLQVHTRPRLDALDIGSIAVEHEQRGGLPAGMLRSIEEYIDLHLEKELRVEELASHLGISASYFTRLFRSSVGLAPHAYVMRRRLSRAQELLASTDLPLIDIALAAGFSDQSHFCRRFHQMTGVSPRTFRLQHR
jgi:AraC-like DNA-binding protein